MAEPTWSHHARPARSGSGGRRAAAGRPGRRPRGSRRSARRSRRRRRTRRAGRAPRRRRPRRSRRAAPAAGSASTARRPCPRRQLRPLTWYLSPSPSSCRGRPRCIMRLAKNENSGAERAASSSASSQPRLREGVGVEQRDPVAVAGGGHARVVGGGEAAFSPSCDQLHARESARSTASTEPSLLRVVDHDHARRAAPSGPPGRAGRAGGTRPRSSPRRRPRRAERQPPRRGPPGCADRRRGGGAAAGSAARRAEPPWARRSALNSASLPRPRGCRPASVALDVARAASRCISSSCTIAGGLGLAEVRHPEVAQRVLVVLPRLRGDDGVVQELGLAGLVVLEVVPRRREVVADLVLGATTQMSNISCSYVYVALVEPADDLARCPSRAARSRAASRSSAGPA